MARPLNSPTDLRDGEQGYLYITGDGHSVMTDAEEPSREEWDEFLGEDEDEDV